MELATISIESTLAKILNFETIARGSKTTCYGPAGHV